jgi:hypothetical protein
MISVQVHMGGNVLSLAHRSWRCISGEPHTLALFIAVWSGSAPIVCSLPFFSYSNVMAHYVDMSAGTLYLKLCSVSFLFRTPFLCTRDPCLFAGTAT